MKYIIIKETKQEKNKYLVGQVAKVLGESMSNDGFKCYKVQTCDNRIIMVDKKTCQVVKNPDRILLLVA